MIGANSGRLFGITKWCVPVDMSFDSKSLTRKCVVRLFCLIDKVNR